MPSKAIVAPPREVASAKATEVTNAASAEVTSAEVASAEAAHMASAEAAHVASAEATTTVASATTTVSSASAATATGICSTRGKKASGKHCACQNHHHSSSHHILLWVGWHFPPQGLVKRRRAQGRQTPSSRWRENGDAYLQSLLNSRSIIGNENAARPESKVGVRH
jgi:hypothetical protein